MSGWFCWCDGARSANVVAFPDRVLHTARMLPALLLLGAASAEPDPDLMSALVLEFEQDGMRAEPTDIDRRYQAACERGDTIACSRESWRGASGPDPELTRAFFTPLCEQGDPIACVVTAWQLSQINPGTSGGNATNPTLGGDLFQRACDAGLQRGCAELGALFVRGVGRAKDEAKGEALLAAACEAGVGNACYLLGDRLDAGRDPTRAHALYERGCAAGDGLSCAYDGVLYENGKAGTTDTVRAAERYARSCDLGTPYGCHQWAQALQEGDGVRADLPRALQLFEGACAKGQAFACNSLGLTHELAIGTPQSATKAIEAYERGCSGGSKVACVSIGILSLQGLAPEVPVARAVTLLDAGCSKGNASACLYAGQARRDGIGVPHDPTAAFALFRTSCEASFGPGCAAMGRAELRGEGAKRDVSEGIRRLSTACLKGTGEACRSVGEHFEASRNRDKRMRALMMFEVGCAFGDLQSCAGERRLLTGRYGATVRGDAKALCPSSGLGCAVAPPADAGELAQVVAACEKGNPVACHFVGARHATGTGTPPRLTTARDLFVKGCKNGNVWSCWRLEDLYSDRAFGVTTTELRAARDRLNGLFGLRAVRRLEIRRGEGPVWRLRVEPSLPEGLVSRGVPLAVCEVLLAVDERGTVGEVTPIDCDEEVLATVVEAVTRWEAEPGPAEEWLVRLVLRAR